MTKRREPSCTNNHDVFRRKLRDEKKDPTPCPTCGWILSPAREEESYLLSSRIQAFIDWLEDETPFGEWDNDAKTEVHKKLIEFLT
jgi:hypothetical protein